jgi:hypothetical protein
MQLAAALEHEDEEQRESARQTLRGLIEKIVIPPGGGLLQVVGNLGDMLTAAGSRAGSAAVAYVGCGGVQPAVLAAVERRRVSEMHYPVRRSLERIDSRSGLQVDVPASGLGDVPSLKSLRRALRGQREHRTGVESPIGIEAFRRISNRPRSTVSQVTTSANRRATSNMSESALTQRRFLDTSMGRLEVRRCSVAARRTHLETTDALSSIRPRAACAA